MKSFPEDLPHGRAVEVVDYRVQNAVKIGQANGEEESIGHTLQSRTHFRVRHGTDLVGLDQDQHLRDAAREEADSEDHHHQCDTVEGLLYLCMLS